MAYKQNPGRGPMMKTGAGVPSALLQKDEKGGKPFVPAGGEFKRRKGPEPTGDSYKDSMLNLIHERGVKSDSLSHVNKERRMLKKGWPKVGDSFGKGNTIRSIDPKDGSYNIKTGLSSNNQKVSRGNVRRASMYGEEIKLTPKGGSNYDEYPKGTVRVGSMTLSKNRK